MFRAALCGLIILGAACAQTPGLVPQVHAAVGAGDFATAGRLLAEYKTAHGATPEYIEAFSWIGRGQLQASHFGEAEENSAEVRKLCEAELKRRALDAEPHLPIALGASIEVAAGVLAKQGQRDQAVVLLRDEIKRWHGTSITMRLQKNLNLLTLEGKPAPLLDVAEGLGERKPLPLASHRGHPVLLFLWAHWCPDCKKEVAVVAKLEEVYGPKGLVVVAPTQHYGYVARGEEATRARETQYMAEVFNQYYAALGKVEVPVSEANFERYGVSTTPTMVLVDGQGIVRMYNPGAADYETLAAKIDAMVRPAHSDVTSALRKASH
ncbi:MAG TPA: TlpA disulfide reductase family protein [Bryobacteraceae bacterium]|nr:TlpA disulfide reductase family protein [Bryobacteraceae bacterium]